MADLAMPTRASPLGAEAPVAVTLLAPMTRLSARADREGARRIGQVFGVELSQAPLRGTAVGPRAALWLGPDEWLLLAPEEAGLARTLEAGLGGEPGCVVDISHRNTGFEVVGPGTDAALAAGCPLDLHPSAFPVGLSTRTCLAKADIVLWRRGTERFHLECWRSFAPYVFAFLHQASADNAG